MIVIDLFSGAGGLTEGFYRENFKIIAHIEKEKWACETLKTRIIYYYLKEQNNLNLYFEYLKKSNNYRTLEKDRQIIFDIYPELKEKLEVEVLNKAFGNPANDINSTSTNDIIELIEKSMRYNKASKVDLIIGGPPCQAYSVIGRARMKESVNKDKRNYLFYYYKSLVEHFKPKMFVFENVPGIFTAQKGIILEKIQEEFHNIGYTLLFSPMKNGITFNVIDSSEFGVYQSRKRVILFGYKQELDLDYPNFFKHTIKLNEEQTTLNAISDLPFLNNNNGHDFYFGDYTNTKSSIPLSKYQQLMREDSIGILNHKARKVQPQDQFIYKLAIENAMNGMQLRYSNIPKEYKTHKNEKNFEDRFKVHWWNNLPHTIVAHISKDGHYNIHPDIKQCRSLTVREAARIQSFPDNYKFEGPRTSQFIQVGNAVPPLMAQAIARGIKELNK